MKSYFYSTLFLLIFGLAALHALAQPTSGYLVDGHPASSSVVQAAQLVQASVALLHTNQNEEAVQKLQQAVVMAPDLVSAHYNLGLALAKLGRTPEAIDQIRYALSLNNQLESAWITLGGFYQASGQIKEAIAIYQQFLNQFPKSTQASQVSSLLSELQAESNHLIDSSTANNDYLHYAVSAPAICWASTRIPIRVYIAPGNNVPGYRTNFGQILQDCFRQWEAACPKKLAFWFVNSPVEVGVNCYWSNNLQEFANATEAGQTEFSTDQLGIKQAIVRLLTIPTSSMLPLTDNRMQAICLHEVGHILGLSRHSSNPTDTMFYSSMISDQKRTLSTNDINAIQYLYSH